MVALASPAVSAQCSDAGLDLPPHFCATVFAQDARQPRHIAVAPSGTVYVNLNRGANNGDLMALFDTDHDGVADRRTLFGQGGATGLAIRDGWLYAASETTVRRYQLTRNGASTYPGQEIVTDLPRQDTHTARGLAVDPDHHLYIAIGAPSNACQKNDRQPGSPGRKPCPLLKRHGGIWQFPADKPSQPFDSEARFATGIRNGFALTYDDPSHQLFAAQMGRDQLDSLWPERFNTDDNTRLPAETLFAVNRDDNFGWPYCYYDRRQHQNVLSPEYGGDGQTVGLCQRFSRPDAAYPAHWAPMAIAFYRQTTFPPHYRGGAFIAFHGSWNRAPEPQGGFRVIYQPFANGHATDDYETFAGPQGFTGQKIVRSPGSATHRPAGLAIGPQGALYISDDQGSTIYRVTYDPNTVSTKSNQ